jgi:hypothetical protein
MSAGETVGWVFFGIFLFIILALALWWFFLRRKPSSNIAYSAPTYDYAPDYTNAGKLYSGGKFSIAMAQNEVYVDQHKDDISAFHAENEKIAEANKREKREKMRDEYDDYY